MCKYKKVLFMKNNVLSFLIAVLFFSCSGKNVEVQRISNLEYVVVSDSIYTRMPGTILYQDGIVFWEDPISFDNIIHAVDVKNRTELLAFGNRGEGPNDFTETIMSLDSEGGIIVNDLNKPLEIHFQVNIDKKSVSFSSYKYDCDNKATRLLYLDKGKVLYHYPEAEKMFQVKENTSEYSFGERPIKEKMNNAYDIFQGQIAYNPQRRLLVYSNLIFPYLSIYKRLDSEGWSQIGEWKENLDYTISEGKLNFAPDSKKGAMELALTNDYIVLLQRDTEIEENISNKDMRGRNMASLPRSLFVYDYDLNLKKIVNMPFPMLRLCGDVETNTVYAMSVNPEFELIKLEL